MTQIILGILFIICIFLPNIFKVLEGLDYTTTEMDMLPKHKEDTVLLNHNYDGPQNYDPDKGQDVTRFMSYAKPAESEGRNLFETNKK